MFPKNYIKFFFVLILLILPGCIGSAFLFGDEEEEGKFGNLATVPERPAPNNFQNYREEIKHLQKEHQEAENINKEIRAEYALTEPKKPERLNKR